MILYDWGLVWDGIDIGRGGEGICGEKTAPDGVATERMLVNEEGGGGYYVRPYLLKIIMDIYGFRFDIHMIEVAKEGAQPPPKAEPISAAIEEDDVIFGGTSSWS